METSTINIHDLIKKLNSIINDYKGGNVITPNRIEKWINQFTEEHKIVILKELIHIFNKFYISKLKTIQSLEEIFSTPGIIGEDFLSNKNSIQFLNIQRTGESQKEILKLVEDIVNEKFNIPLEECGSTPRKYIYIDDCFYSGNHTHRDIEAWIENANEGSELHLVYFAVHTKQYNYVKREITKLTKAKKMSLHFWCDTTINNSRSFNNTTGDNKFECLWAPKFLYSDDVNSYVELILEDVSNAQKQNFPLLRDTNVPVEETLFTNKINRDIVEKEFFEKGVHIKSFGINKNKNMRALGYDYDRNTLGFGSMFVNYRNIANNCPLVLWWGEEDATPGLGNWYPLFPRKANS